MYLYLRIIDKINISEIAGLITKAKIYNASWALSLVKVKAESI